VTAWVLQCTLGSTCVASFSVHWNNGNWTWQHAGSSTTVDDVRSVVVGGSSRPWFPAIITHQHRRYSLHVQMAPMQHGACTAWHRGRNWPHWLVTTACWPRTSRAAMLYRVQQAYHAYRLHTDAAVAVPANAIWTSFKPKYGECRTGTFLAPPGGQWRLGVSKGGRSPEIFCRLYVQICSFWQS